MFRPLPRPSPVFGQLTNGSKATLIRPIAGMLESTGDPPFLNLFGYRGVDLVYCGAKLVEIFGGA